MMESKLESNGVDDAYYDRNQAVLAFAKLADEVGYPVGVLPSDEDGWFVLLIDLPQGQVSWHIPYTDLVGTWYPYCGKWDGHNLLEKRLRMKRYILESVYEDGE